jgi:hypothetical protein
VVDAELFRLDSVVRWLDAADARLRRAMADGWTQDRAPQATMPALARRRRMGARQ